MVSKVEEIASPQIDNKGAVIDEIDVGTHTHRKEKRSECNKPHIKPKPKKMVLRRSHHSISAEQKALIDTVNEVLINDKDCTKYLPISSQCENLKDNIKDGVLLCKFFNKVQPGTIDERVINTRISEESKTENVTLALNSAKAIGCNIAELSPKKIQEASPKVVLDLLGEILENGLHRKVYHYDDKRKEKEDTIPSSKQMPIPLELLSKPQPKVILEDTYCNWMNSMQDIIGIRCGYDLYEGLRDGLIILKLCDIICPGIVQWKKVNQKFTERNRVLAQQENCQYVLELSQDNRLSLKFIGMTASEICKGNKTFILSIAWQLMRAYTNSVLTKCSASIYVDKDNMDKGVLNWANEKLKQGGKSTEIESFQDLSLSTSLAVIDLVDCIQPGIVDNTLITRGETMEDKFANAQYGISLARKIGAIIYTLPQHVVESNSKMIMAAFMGLMTRDLSDEIIYK